VRASHPVQLNGNEYRRGDGKSGKSGEDPHGARIASFADNRLESTYEDKTRRGNADHLQDEARTQQKATSPQTVSCVDTPIEVSVAIHDGMQAAPLPLSAIKPSSRLPLERLAPSAQHKPFTYVA
jgi:hypothetical protein